MNAKEMFEALGYKDETNNMTRGISYHNPSNLGIIRPHKGIFFNRQSKYISIIGNVAKTITIDEFKACEQQMKELGWIK